MRHHVLAFGALLTAVLSLAIGSATCSRAVPGADAPPGVPVIVELFTSEGCSSCPPADNLLAMLEDQQVIPHAHVIALEEHVDYWNHDGWLDPFSATEWTQRQQEYDDSLRSGVYTPQMIVNGRTQMVGSNARQAQQAIAAAVMQMKTNVSITPGFPDQRNSAEFDVKVGKILSGLSKDTPEVWLAITESGLQSSVTRGENSGKELKHASVVRSLRKIGTADPSKDSSFSQGVSVGLSSGWNRQNLHAVVFVQHRTSRQIIGAAVSRLEPKPLAIGVASR
jgi:hypothetical protein